MSASTGEAFRAERPQDQAAAREDEQLLQHLGRRRTLGSVRIPSLLTEREKLGGGLRVRGGG
jgi:hypothetical protein